MIFVHLDFNLLRNKFEFLAKLVRGRVDIQMILETKCDESFPLGQFYIDACNTPFCLDRSSSGGARQGGFMPFVRVEIYRKN